MAVTLVISGLLVGCMVGLSVYAARVLPPTARIPLHYGLGSYNNFARKTVGLVMWPASGAVVYGIFAAVAANAIKPNHPGGPVLFIMPVVLMVLVIAQAGAITTAMRATRDRAG